MATSYAERVQEAADALGQGEAADWLVARLTFENTRRGAGRPWSDSGAVTMEKWCADVQKASSVRLRFGVPTGRRYVLIWQRYGLNSSQASELPNFKDAYEEAGGTPDRERMMAYEANRLLEEGTPEQKTSAAVALMRDPVVVDRIAEAAVVPDSEPAQALEGLNDRVVEQRMEQALDEPTVAVAAVQRRIHEAQENDAAYQYDRLKQTLSAYFARYTPEDVADSIAASPHTDRLDLYLTGADQVLEWFQGFRRAVAERARPRLVQSVESAG